jgi:hypothetical protein
VNAAAHEAYLRARITPHLHASLWTRHYDEASCTAEFVLTAANASIPDLVSVVPDVRINWIGAQTLVPGLQFGKPLMVRGDSMADGQSRAWPLVFVWPAKMKDADWPSVAAQAEFGISANGVARLWPLGTPAPRKVDVRAMFNESLASLHRWKKPRGLGVNEISYDTGAQEDQIYVGAECALPGGELARYMVALNVFKRPSLQLEASGALLDLAKHPKLVYWNGRVHWHEGVSPDRLSKPALPGLSESHNWIGPDVEHWLMSSVYVANRTRHSYAMQHQLENQARIYLLQWTIRRGLSTSQPYASRAVGYEALNVVLLDQSLTDRVLAAQVVQRYRERVQTLILPWMRARAEWDVRLNDPRLGQGAWWMPWQHALGAEQSDLAGLVLNIPELRVQALKMAEHILARAWREVDGRWQSAYALPVSGDAPFTESMNLFGMCLAPVTVLRHRNDERAQRLYDWLREQSGGPSHPWLPPSQR